MSGVPVMAETYLMYLVWLRNALCTCHGLEMSGVPVMAETCLMYLVWLRNALCTWYGWARFLASASICAVGSDPVDRRQSRGVLLSAS
jgi:hypothetical protein